MKTELFGNAYLVKGEVGELPILKTFLEKQAGIEMGANADVYARAYDSFGVEEAREIRDRAALRAVGESPRIFIIAAPSMTVEAQNAFLKTLEEPPGNAKFFFLVPSPDTLLPTVRSRMQRLELPRKESTDTARLSIEANAFLKATPEKRLDMIAPLLEKDDDEKRDMSAILSFLASLERAIAKQSSKEGAVALYRARKYMLDKGALVKPLLEQVALLVPRI